jgi:hypothetical protein
MLFQSPILWTKIEIEIELGASVRDRDRVRDRDLDLCPKDRAQRDSGEVKVTIAHLLPFSSSSSTTTIQFIFLCTRLSLCAFMQNVNLAADLQ